MKWHELDTSLLEMLGGNTAFWSPAERRDLLNEAATLLCALKPGVLTRWKAVSIVADEPFLDLQQHAADLLRLEDVILGNVTGDDPGESQGELHHLRPTSLRSLRGHHDWLLEVDHAMTHRAQFGLTWLIFWPRADRPHTMTLVYRASPARCTIETANAEPEVGPLWQPVITEIAAALARIKEGGTEAQQSIATLQRVFGQEHVAHRKASRKAAAS